MGIHTIVGLIPSSQIKTPALFGFVRPRLLLPMEMLEKTSSEELRYIFLHELAHLKRHDIYLGWLTSLLQILHWFNPLVWLAFFRMRSDRELSCDALVLSRTGTDESQEYGQAIVGLVRRFSRSQPLPAMAGILENKSQLKRRIAMIAQFKKSSYQWSPLAVILILALGLVSFSFAVGGLEQNTYLPKSEPNISLRRIVTGPISDFSGPPSLDGRYLCDIRPTAELTIAELFVRDMDAEEILPLIKVSRNGMWYPTVSPHNTHIAYMNQFYPEPGTELQMINMDGSGHRAMHRFEEGENFVIRSWALDGTKIFGDLRKQGEDRKLIAFSIVDGSMQVLHNFNTDEPSWNSILAMSPDGRYVAYDRTQEKDSTDRDIYILDIASNQTKPLVQNAADDILLGWTPDNNYIFFASNRKRGYPSARAISDTWDAYLLSVTNGVSQDAPELVKRDLPDKIRPKGFTQDGTFYYGVEFSTMEAVVAKVDMQTGELLSKPQTIGHTGTDVTPAWSPDGRFLAYGIQNRDNTQTISIRDMKSGQERRLSPDLPQFFSLRWSPDGKFILVSTFKPKEPQAIYRINASNDEREVLVRSESAMLGAAQISKDGKTLLYVTFQPDSQKASLLSKNMDSNQEKNLYSLENSMGAQGLNFALSPDGQLLALASFVKQGPPIKLFHQILIVPVQGGESKELFSNQDLKQYPLIDWTPDGKFLLFSNSHFRGRPSAVWRIPANGGQAIELSQPQPMMYGVLWSSLDVHPDGKRIAFDCFEYRHEVWAMENFLPKMSGAKGK